IKIARTAKKTAGKRSRRSAMAEVLRWLVQGPSGQATCRPGCHSPARSTAVVDHEAWPLACLWRGGSGTIAALLRLYVASEQHAACTINLTDLTWLTSQ